MQLLVAVGVLLGIRNEDLATDVLDPERRIAGGESRVGEVAGQVGGRPRPIEHVDRPVREVGGIQVIRAAGAADRKAEVDRVRRCHGVDGRGALPVPAGDLAVIRGEDESGRRRSGGADLDLEIGRGAVEDDACRGARDGEGERDLGTGRPVVEGRLAGAVVGDPPGRRRARDDSPAVHEIGVLVVCGTGDVGEQPVNRVQVVGVDVPSRCRDRHGQEQPDARDEGERTSCHRRSSCSAVGRPRDTWGGQDRSGDQEVRRIHGPGFGSRIPQLRRTRERLPMRARSSPPAGAVRAVRLGSSAPPSAGRRPAAAIRSRADAATSSRSRP